MVVPVTNGKTWITIAALIVAAVSAASSIAGMKMAGVFEIRDRLARLEERQSNKADLASVAVLQADLRAMQNTVAELAAIMRKVSDDEALDERLRAASREMYRTLERRREDDRQ